MATDEMIQDALLITGGAFVIALLWLGWGAWATSRRDRRVAARSSEGSR